MKRTFYLAITFLFFFTSITFAKSVHVRGSATKSGQYRSPHQRTAPNKTKLDNWSTKGNVNPYTGKTGTTDPFKK